MRNEISLTKYDLKDVFAMIREVVLEEDGVFCRAEHQAFITRFVRTFGRIEPLSVTVDDLADFRPFVYECIDEDLLTESISTSSEHVFYGQYVHRFVRTFE